MKLYYDESMREINTERITEAIAGMTGDIACVYQPDIVRSLQESRKTEESPRAQAALEMLVKNAEIAEKERIPICQDTGLAIVWLKIGHDVHLVGGSLRDAVNEGVRKGYTENYLRASSVYDPLFERRNTGDNTPAVLYTEIVDGDRVEVELMGKGFGSENKSALKMLTPADGIEGLVSFVKETVVKAGANACPPFVIGIGVGGTFDSCAVNAKKALFRPLSESNPDERYRDLEERLLKEINDLGIGPLGLHGKTTALKVHIESAPTHIAGLPVAVNMCCHVCRHGKVVI